MPESVRFVIDIFLSLFSVFFGFLLAMWFHNHNTKKAHEESVKKILLSLHDELGDINSEAARHIEKNTIMDNYIPIPVWDAIVHSSILLEMVEMKFYTEVITAYSAIGRFNQKYDVSNENNLKLLQIDIIEHTAEAGEAIDSYLEGVKKNERRKEKRKV